MNRTSMMAFSLCLSLSFSTASLHAEYPEGWQRRMGASPQASRVAGTPSPVVDGVNDTFPTVGVALDIDVLAVNYDFTHLNFEMTFHTPIAPASAGTPERLVGNLEFDTDQDVATGTPPLQTTIGPPVPGVAAGIEFYIDFISEANHAGEADVIGTGVGVVGRIPLIFGPMSVAGSIPLAMLGGDDGKVDYTAIIGNTSGPTDAMNELGQSVQRAAPVESFTIVDGTCEYTVRGLIGNRETNAGGLADLKTDSLEHLFQDWFWYRSTEDTREYALSNQIAAEVEGNHARLLYGEPVGITRGAYPLLIDLEYTLTDLGADRGTEPPACARCDLVVTAAVRNLTGERLNIAFFSYNDMDLGESAAGDTATIAGDDNQAQLILEPGAPATDSYSVVSKVSSSGHTGWEISVFADIRNRLVDNNIDDLASAGSPFGPNDYTGAQQWSFELGPVGNLFPQDVWIGSVDRELTVFRRGDLDGDCAVDLFDHALMQNQFTGP